MKVYFQFILNSNEDSSAQSVHMTVIFDEKRILLFSAYNHERKIVDANTAIYQIHLDVQLKRKKICSCLKIKNKELLFWCDEDFLSKINHDEWKEYCFKNKKKLIEHPVYRFKMKHQEWYKKFKVLTNRYSENEISLENVMDRFLILVKDEFNVAIDSETEIFRKHIDIIKF